MTDFVEVKTQDLADYAELKRLAEAANKPGCSWSTDYRLATSPSAVLALIAENEALRKALKPLLEHWSDLEPGESVYVDAARAALSKGEQP
ncbi:hypothetical protein KHO49_16535 [Pseudomonas sp. RC4D1]|uniref:hypothetical protein n=1 Tax=Pseudomonas sp. RC4D1 TaxID=2834407 RepID=UPI001BCB849D|nr:hypothetical protein [Pseudomonas sp. RC4D1]MBS7559951.1 hypothetical protein [Pseudomonas sp. RC4D1]